MFLAEREASSNGEGPDDRIGVPDKRPQDVGFPAEQRRSPAAPPAQGIGYVPDNAEVTGVEEFAGTRHPVDGPGFQKPSQCRWYQVAQDAVMVLEDPDAQLICDRGSFPGEAQDKKAGVRGGITERAVPDD